MENVCFPKPEKSAKSLQPAIDADQPVNKKDISVTADELERYFSAPDGVSRSHYGANSFNDPLAKLTYWITYIIASLLRDEKPQSEDELLNSPSFLVSEQNLDLVTELLYAEICEPENAEMAILNQSADQNQNALADFVRNKKQAAIVQNATGIQIRPRGLKVDDNVVERNRASHRLNGSSRIKYTVGAPTKYTITGDTKILEYKQEGDNVVITDSNGRNETTKTTFATLKLHKEYTGEAARQLGQISKMTYAVEANEYEIVIGKEHVIKIKQEDDSVVLLLNGKEVKRFDDLTLAQYKEKLVFDKMRLMKKAFETIRDKNTFTPNAHLTKEDSESIASKLNSLPDQCGQYVQCPPTNVNANHVSKMENMSTTTIVKRDNAHATAVVDCIEPTIGVSRDHMQSYSALVATAALDFAKNNLHTLNLLPPDELKRRFLNTLKLIDSDDKFGGDLQVKSNRNAAFAVVVFYPVGAKMMRLVASVGHVVVKDDNDNDRDSALSTDIREGKRSPVIGPAYYDSIKSDEIYLDISEVYSDSAPMSICTEGYVKGDRPLMNDGNRNTITSSSTSANENQRTTEATEELKIARRQLALLDFFRITEKGGPHGNQTSFDSIIDETYSELIKPSDKAVSENGSEASASGEISREEKILAIQDKHRQLQEDVTVLEKELRIAQRGDSYMLSVDVGNLVRELKLQAGILHRVEETVYLDDEIQPPIEVNEGASELS